MSVMLNAVFGHNVSRADIRFLGAFFVAQANCNYFPHHVQTVIHYQLVSKIAGYRFNFIGYLLPGIAASSRLRRESSQ